MLPRFVDSSNRPSYCSPFHLYLPVSLSTNVHPSRLSVFFSAIGFYDISLLSSRSCRWFLSKHILRSNCCEIWKIPEELDYVSNATFFSSRNGTFQMTREIFLLQQLDLLRIFLQFRKLASDVITNYPFLFFGNERDYDTSSTIGENHIRKIFRPSRTSLFDSTRTILV